MSTELLLNSRPVATVFDLLGVMENDRTYTLGWVLSPSPLFARHFAEACGVSDPGEAVSVELQRAAGPGGGFTDVEINYRNAYLLLEAKRGWNLPSLQQLSRYRPSCTEPARSLIVTLSEASQAYAVERLPRVIDGVAVKHVPWLKVLLAARTAAQSRAANERRLLREFESYLRGAIRMQDLFSTWTYCVSVSGRGPGWPKPFQG